MTVPGSMSGWPFGHRTAHYLVHKYAWRGKVTKSYITITPEVHYFRCFAGNWIDQRDSSSTICNDLQTRVSTISHHRPKTPPFADCRLEFTSNTHALSTPFRTQGISVSLHVFGRDGRQTQHGPARVPVATDDTWHRGWLGQKQTCPGLGSICNFRYPQKAPPKPKQNESVSCRSGKTSQTILRNTSTSTKPIMSCETALLDPTISLTT